jgi:hypothetical protein
MLLTLEPFYSVAAVGVLAGAPNAAMPPGNSATIFDATGHLLPYLPQYDDATHSVQANLPDGSYMMLMQGVAPPRLRINGQGDVSVKMRGAPTPYTGMTAFTVAGHPIAGLRIPLDPPHPAPVLVRYLHTGVAPATPRTTGSDDSNASITLGAEQADGLPVPDIGGSQIPVGDDSFDLSVPWPGAYWFTVYIPQKNLCADSLKGGGANLAREPLALNSLASSAPMELTLRDDCAQLSLTLPEGLAQFAPGEEPFYTVYVVPDFDTVQDIPPLAVHPSSGATLTVDGLTPGNYHVYTFGSPVRLEYRNRAVLAALPNPGQAVTLAPGGTGSLVLEVPAP